MRPLAIVALALAVWPARAAADRPDVEGRVFARQTVSQVELIEDLEAPWTWNQQIASARLNVEYSHKKVLKTAIEVEFSDGDAEMKDVYVRWRPVRSFTVKAGRFKKPISAVQLEGLWDLPVIERGLLSDLEFSGVALPLGGRGDGILFAFEPRQLPFEVQLAVFQPELLVSIDATETFAADVYARIELDVTDDVTWGTTFGAASYLEKPDKGEGFRRAPVGSVDLTITAERFRLWADLMLGIDPLPFALDVSTIDLPCDTEDMSCPPVELIADRGLFVAARGVASVRFEPSRYLRTVEPYLTASLIDLNAKFQDDEARQYGGGVASKINKRLRWQLQVDRTTAAADAPVAEATRAMFQVGAAF